MAEFSCFKQGARGLRPFVRQPICQPAADDSESTNGEVAHPVRHPGSCPGVGPSHRCGAPAIRRISKPPDFEAGFFFGGAGGGTITTGHEDRLTIPAVVLPTIRS
jgi:hypothetical protein